MKKRITLPLIQLIFLGCCLAFQATAQQISMSKTNFAPDEDVYVNYTGINRPPDGFYIINLISSNSPGNILDSYSYVKEFTSGQVKLYGKWNKGNYEVRLLNYKTSADTAPALLQKIPVTIGSEPAPPVATAKPASQPTTSRPTPTQKPSPAASASASNQQPNATKGNSATMNCNTAIPSVVGSRTAGAPDPATIARILRGIMSETWAPRWLQGKDLCVEVGPIKYLPKSTVRLFSDWENPAQANLGSWPVQTRVIIKYPKGNEVETRVFDKPNEAYYFFKDASGNWNYKVGGVK